MKLRLEPTDEYMHDLEEASNFNESMYFNVFDPNERVGGFLRLGNRANEHYAEMTTCLYLPDGRVAFMFSRPEISDNDAFDSGGMRFEVIEPFETLRVTYKGKVALLDDPLHMANPRKAFTENPWVDAEVELAYRGVSPMWGGEPVNDDGSQRIGGVALEDGEYRNIDRATVETEWEGADAYHRTIRAKAHTAEREYEIEGSVLNLIPLRNRRTTADGEQLVTRISEGMTEWRWDGRTGYGLSEYLDQIVDGKPAGLTT